MKKIIFVLSTSLLLTSCEEGKVPPEKTFNMPQPLDSQNNGQLQTVSLTIKAIGNNMTAIAFEPKEIEVHVNSIIEITLINESTVEGMNHNIVFVELGSGAEVSAEGLAIGPEKEYIPNNPKVIAGSKVALPGETIQMHFSAPKAGSYHFICTYPGHYPQMIGRMNVVQMTQ
ncbi:MAG: hypothetical protein H0V01_14755 [Bacteroidetes bacterium]|nr:hypothetical protein [Bacteroidota bacterium]HET6242943.1 plastocyanin/azurin family copper-binding protein [Bacteroidia bacterium]